MAISVSGVVKKGVVKLAVKELPIPLIGNVTSVKFATVDCCVLSDATAVGATVETTELMIELPPSPFARGMGCLAGRRTPQALIRFGMAQSEPLSLISAITTLFAAKAAIGPPNP